MSQCFYNKLSYTQMYWLELRVKHQHACDLMGREYVALSVCEREQWTTIDHMDIKSYTKYLCMNGSVIFGSISTKSDN